MPQTQSFHKHDYYKLVWKIKKNACAYIHIPYIRALIEK